MSFPPNQVSDLIFTYNLARITYFHILLSVKEYKSKKTPNPCLLSLWSQSIVRDRLRGTYKKKGTVDFYRVMLLL